MSRDNINFARVGQLVESRWSGKSPRPHIVCDIDRRYDNSRGRVSPARWSYLLDNGKWVWASDWVKYE